MAAITPVAVTKSSYAELRRKVEEVLLQGQRKIEEAKVLTYWTAGKLIHEHVLQYKGRAEHGSRVIQKLASDLEVSRRLIYQTLQFYEAFPIVHARAQFKLSWTHYRQLSAIADEETREELLKRAAASRWSERELAGKIREEVRSAGRAARNGKYGPADAVPRLIPKRGELYTYRLLQAETVHGGEEQLWLDTGFNNHHLVKVPKGARPGRIVESVKREDGSYSVKLSTRTEAALFTYKAKVERVVDGDTLIVLVDQGFKSRTRRYLRLRGINCAELDKVRSLRKPGQPVSLGGKRAKLFLEKLLDKIPEVVLTSSRPDKYGRYLADLFIPKEEEFIFVNQRLLDEGLAVRVKE